MKVNNLYGLIGNKLGHSSSQLIHNCIFEKLKIDAYYHMFEVEQRNLGTALLGLKALGAAGINVTIPYKCEVMKFLDDISTEANSIGAVNTIGFDNNKAIGYNTDYYGFKMMMEKNLVTSKGKKIVVLGSGGAADSVLHYFLEGNTKEIYVISRRLDETKLKYKPKDVIICNYSDVEKIKNIDIIVNCTPCGMYPFIDAAPVGVNVLKNTKMAIDLIYNPKETIFIKEAKNLGIEAINGLYMLVAQAVKAQELWNGLTISQDMIEYIYNLL